MLLLAFLLACATEAQDETGACEALHCDITLSDEEYSFFAGDDGVMDATDCRLPCESLSCVGDQAVLSCEAVGDRALNCEYSHACY
ncbi:MAG: hypothetical protein V4850_30790 [Myxococcota bacterium]